MNSGVVVMVVVATISASGTIVAAVWSVISGRRKPDIDKAQLQEMINKSNTWRDRRLAQLENHMDAITGWQFKFVTQFRKLIVMLKELRANGTLPPDLEFPNEVPDPPPVPEPPPRD